MPHEVIEFPRPQPAWRAVCSGWQPRPDNGNLRGFAAITIMPIGLRIPRIAIFENALAKRSISLPRVPKIDGPTRMIARSGGHEIYHPVLVFENTFIAAQLQAEVLRTLDLYAPDAFARGRRH